MSNKKCKNGEKKQAQRRAAAGRSRHIFVKTLIQNGTRSSQPKYHIPRWKDVTSSLKTIVLVLYTGQNRKIPIKSVKSVKRSKNQKNPN